MAAATAACDVGTTSVRASSTLVPALASCAVPMPHFLGALEGEGILLPTRSAEFWEGASDGSSHSDSRGGTGKAEDAKLRGAGIIPKRCLRKKCGKRRDDVVAIVLKGLDARSFSLIGRTTLLNAITSSAAISSAKFFVRMSTGSLRYQSNFPFNRRILSLRVRHNGQILPYYRCQEQNGLKTSGAILLLPMISTSRVGFAYIHLRFWDVPKST